MMILKVMGKALSTVRETWCSKSEGMVCESECESVSESESDGRNSDHHRQRKGVALKVD